MWNQCITEHLSKPSFTVLILSWCCKVLPMWYNFYISTALLNSSGTELHQSVCRPQARNVVPSFLTHSGLSNSGLSPFSTLLDTHTCPVMRPMQYVVLGILLSCLQDAHASKHPRHSSGHCHFPYTANMAEHVWSTDRITFIIQMIGWRSKESL